MSNFRGVLILASIALVLLVSTLFFFLGKDEDENGNNLAINNEEENVEVMDYTKGENNKNENEEQNNETNINEEGEENEDNVPYYESDEPLEDYGYGDEDYYDDLFKQESEEAEPITPLEEIYGEEEFKQAVGEAERFIELYNNVDGDNPNHPDEILDELESMMFEISWNQLPLVVKTLITHSNYKTKLVDYERRDTEFSPADASVPMQLVFTVVLEVQDFDGNKREVQQNQIVYLRQLFSGDYQISGFAINKIFK